ASRRVFGTLRREHVEIQYRLVADHDAVMHHVGRHREQSARAEADALVADEEIDLALQDVDDLLVMVRMGARLVAGMQPMQRQGRTVAAERLALDARTHRLPLDLAPVDGRDLHRRLPALALFRRGHARREARTFLGARLRAALELVE